MQIVDGIMNTKLIQGLDKTYTNIPSWIIIRLTLGLIRAYFFTKISGLQFVFYSH